MEKAAVAGNQAGSRWEIPPLRCAAVLLAVGVACPAMAAVDDLGQASAEVLMAEARVDQPAMRVQVRTSTLPRMDAQDTGFQAPRVDLSLTPANSRGLGAVVGVSGFAPGATPLGLQPQRPSVDFGLRWSHTLQSQHQVDVMAWRRMNTPDDAYSLIQQKQPVYGARVEMNLARASKSGFALDRGFIGMQLESGARITVKRKDGRPMVYYRTSF
jgi:hypothetical protein